MKGVGLGCPCTVRARDGMIQGGPPVWPDRHTRLNSSGLTSRSFLSGKRTQYFTCEVVDKQSHTSEGVLTGIFMYLVLGLISSVICSN